MIDDINRAAGELESLEKERLEARQDIDGLALQKKRLEVLVRKASLALFLKEQHSLYEKRVLEKLDESTELGSDLVELKRLKDQLNELEEEIENHEDVDLLNEIIRKAGRTTIAIDVFPRGSLLLQISRAVDSLLKGR